MVSAKMTGRRVPFGPKGDLSATLALSFDEVSAEARVAYEISSDAYRDSIQLMPRGIGLRSERHGRWAIRAAAGNRRSAT